MYATLFMVGVLLLALLFQQGKIWGNITGLTLVVCLLLNQRFTKTVTITDNELVIDYYRWCAKHSKTFLLAEITLVVRVVTSKWGKKPLLDIKEGESLVYIVDGNDGFDKNDFELITSYYNKVTGDGSLLHNIVM